MTKIAIDVALLPPDKIMDEAIELNKELLKNNEKRIVLNKENCLPHLTLCMGVIDEKDMPKINKILNNIAEQSSALSLKLLKIHVTSYGFSELDVEMIDKLVSFRENIIKQLDPYLTYKVTKNMLFNPEEINDLTVYWVETYKKYALNWRAHITTGYGKLEQVDLPINFTATRLALCQLGNCCTCRKILWEGELK